MPIVTDLEVPSEEERAYLGMFGVVAIFVATGRAGTPCMIGRSRDLEATRHSLLFANALGMELVAAYWLRDAKKADVLAAAISDHFRERITPDGLLRITGEVARRAIETLAAERGIQATCHDLALSRVRAALQRMNEMIAAAQKCGGMAPFNEAYREYREGRQARRLPAMTYAEALGELRAAIVRRIAAGSLVTIGKSVIDEALGRADAVRRTARV